MSFCDHVFRTLDTDGNGYLDFKVVNKILRFAYFALISIMLPFDSFYTGC